MSVCVSTCPFTFWGTVKMSFCPHYPKLDVRDSEFLRKSSGKKWSKIWTFLLKKGLKLPPQKKFFLRIKKKLFTFDVPFKGLFDPTSQSRMSKIFRDSESLGKSNEKKRSQMWIFWLTNGLKLPKRNNFFTVFFLFSLHLNVFVPPLPNVQTF